MLNDVAGRPLGERLMWRPLSGAVLDALLPSATKQPSRVMGCAREMLAR